MQEKTLKELLTPSQIDAFGMSNYNGLVKLETPLFNVTIGDLLFLTRSGIFPVNTTPEVLSILLETMVYGK